MKGQLMDIKYCIIVFLATICTWFVHEFAHWSISEYLGNDTTMTMNSTYPTMGAYSQDRHAILVSAAGPIVTLIQAIVVLFIFKFQGFNKYLYPFLMAATYMRILASLMNIVHVNDEGRISEFLGLGVFFLPLVVSACLIFIMYKVAVSFGLRARFQALTLILVMTCSSSIILLDQYFKIIIL